MHPLQAMRHAPLSRFLALFPAPFVALFLALFLAFPTCVLSQNYPAKPIRMVSAITGGAEILARLIAQKMNESLGQPVIIDNRGGAAGNIGLEVAAKALPDGYTILASSGSAIKPPIGPFAVSHVW